MEGTLNNATIFKNKTDPVYGKCSDYTVPIAQWSQERKRSTRMFIEAQLDAYEQVLSLLII